MEKFDGIRVYWDGKQLYSQNSKYVLNVPQDCKFPNIPFEGELWYAFVTIINLL
jgi:DNA ligase-1